MSHALDRLLARTVERVLASPVMGPWLRRRLVAAAPLLRGAMAAAPQSLPREVTVPEVTSLPPRRLPGSAAGGGRRLNLLIPAVSEQHVFGGIATALRLFESLQGRFEQARIVVMDETHPQPAPHHWFGAWPMVPLEEDAPPARHIVAAGDRYQRSLAVGPGDVFMATAWWTAYTAHRLLDWQAEQFGEAAIPQFIYLIQDYEPGFYAWSSRYALAASTYSPSSRIRAVVNTQGLADHFAAQGHAFASVQVLEPRLNPALAAHRSAQEVVTKEPVLMVYGRPAVERNAFSLILMALREWVALDPEGARQWQVVSAGEPFADVDLGHGVALRNLGKLSLDAYAQWLRRSAVGVSIMVSPHPSYPPLEMAAFGATVLTNGFANKDLSTWSNRIVSLPHLDPTALARSLQDRTASFMAQPPQARQVDLRAVRIQGPFLQPGHDVQGLETVLQGIV